MSSTPDETGPAVISDEELQKLSIGELKLHNAPITLVEYDLSWPRLFAREADRIRVVLGDTALRIEHVGSTSVPGLAAKPIIDILLVVANSVDESSYVPNLEAAGYVLRIREPEWFEHRLFKGPDTNINLHVFSVGAAEIDRMLRFRDWLRATDADRDYYARVKRDLAQRTWRHVQHYADAKTAVVQEITERATPRQRAVTARDHSDQPMTENVMVRAARREDLSAVRELERAAGAAFRDLDMAAVADDEPPTITELLAFPVGGDLAPVVHQTMVRVRGIVLSSVDFGGVGPTVLALHGVFGRGAVFATLAEQLQGTARVVALDQRGHGLAEHGGPFTRDEFVADAAAVIDQLGSGPVVVLGHSLGGITAYQLAAQHPKLVRALITEDISTVVRQPEVSHPVLDVRGWPRYAPTREALAEAIRAHGVLEVDYFLLSAVVDEQGWRLLFDYSEMMTVQHHGLGDWWHDWLASSCPALLLHGQRSTMLTTGMAHQMVHRRPGTQLVEFPHAGHFIHDDDPAGCATAIRNFLSTMSDFGSAGIGSAGR